MPGVNELIGPLAAVYVGNFGAPDVLTEIPSPRTQGGRFRFRKPEDWEDCDGEYRQTGRVQVSADLVFYWNEDAERLALGNALTTANLDDPPAQQHFTVLLLSPDEDLRTSILLPECVATCNLDEFMGKTEFTSIPVAFFFADRNKKRQIYRKGTYTELAAILTTRSPI